MNSDLVKPMPPSHAHPCNAVQLLSPACVERKTSCPHDCPCEALKRRFWSRREPTRVIREMERSEGFTQTVSLREDGTGANAIRSFRRRRFFGIRLRRNVQEIAVFPPIERAQFRAQWPVRMAANRRREDWPSRRRTPWPCPPAWFVAWLGKGG